MIVAEGLYAMLFRQRGLCGSRLRHPEIIIAKVGRDMRLIMPPEERLCFADIRPLGKAFAPPLVIFRNRMVLRKIKSDHAGHKFSLL